MERAPGPSTLPEMRDVVVDATVLARVDQMIIRVTRQLESLKRFYMDGKGETTQHVSLTNVGLAMVATTRVKEGGVVSGRLSMAERVLLRQAFLEAGWDEVQFEFIVYPTDNSCELMHLIEYKTPALPRTRLRDVL